MSQPEELQIASGHTIKQLLEPIQVRLDAIEQKLQNQVRSTATKKYYRNIEIKKMFGISNNTIIKYRENGTLPHTMLGDIYLYDAEKIDKILEDNHA